MTTAPGTYEVCGGRVEVLPNGAYVLEGLLLKPMIQPEPPAQTLKDLWKPGAPFSFDYMVQMLDGSGITKDGIWISFPIRGNHPTGSVEVRALYETLLMLDCIDTMSFPEVMRVFNNTFDTRIRCAKVIENKRKCIRESRFFAKLFEAFANPDANADTSTEAE